MFLFKHLQQNVNKCKQTVHFLLVQQIRRKRKKETKENFPCLSLINHYKQNLNKPTNYKKIKKTLPRGPDKKKVEPGRNSTSITNFRARSIFGKLFFADDRPSSNFSVTSHKHYKNFSCHVSLFFLPI
jgi:hypothetical protein